MTRSADERVWERALAGEHTALVGASKLEPPASLWLLRASCDVPGSTLGPIVDAQRKASRVLGDHEALLDSARHFVVTGLRRRFLGAVEERGPATAGLVEVCYRLSRQEQRYALVFEAVDAADDATLEDLGRLLKRPNALALPLILMFRDQPMPERTARLLHIMLEVHGDESVIRAAPERADMPEPAAPFAWRGLPFEVLQVMRAGAVIGSGFEAELLAELLECSPLDVLDCVQQAADAGAPIDDRGEGRFFLPERDVEVLRGSLLPSLQAAWHRRLGWLLAAEDEYEDDEGSEWTDIRDSYEELEPPPARVWDTPSIDSDRFERSVQAGVGGLDYDDAAVTLERVPIRTPRFAEVFEATPEVRARDSEKLGGGDAEEEEEREQDQDQEREQEQDQDQDRDQDRAARRRDVVVPVAQRATVREIPAQTSKPGLSSVPPIKDSDAGKRHRDPARAASHLSAAGQLEQAARKYAAAAGEASAIGAYEQAMAHGRQALQLIESLPDTPERRQFRAQMLIAIGRLQWQAAGMLDGHPDPAFSLEHSLETAHLAMRLLRDQDPADLLAEAHSLIAGICYDLGTADALDSALEHLTRAAQLLLSEDQVTDAARLLNDQAAVYVRLGDPVRATHLLTESQKIFEERAANDQVAIRELAETHHLLARLPLHAPIRQGRETEAYAMAIEHAARAEEKYQELGDVREIARTWETRARMELLRGERDAAAQRLSSALQVQSQIGDLTGLARSTAALSDVLAADGRYSDALAVLGDSITLNQEKGSPIGLAFNRRSFDKLEHTITQTVMEADPNVEQALVAVRGHLEAAESGLGRLTLPGEA